MIAAHICERDLPLRDFVGGFEGLARTRVRADVLEAACLKGSHLSDLVRGKGCRHGMGNTVTGSDAGAFVLARPSLFQDRIGPSCDRP